MFWVTDNFLMKKPAARGQHRKRAVRYQRVTGGGGNNNTSALLPTSIDDSDALLSGDEDLLDSTEDVSSSAINSSPLAFKNVDELLNVNRRTNSVIWMQMNEISAAIP